jgi:hypothetical protein
MASIKPHPGGARTITTGGVRSLGAIELLKADHRQVEEWFADYDTARSPAARRDLARRICHALTVHTRLEEDLFYPAFREATGDEALVQEAVADHDEAGEVIAEIEDASLDQEASLDDLVRTLAAMIRRHVAEEEQPGGMFAQAEASGMDLVELGAGLERRKLELMDDAATDAGYDAAVAEGSIAEFDVTEPGADEQPEPGA